MYDCFLSLGSNLGKRQDYIDVAIEMLRGLERTAVIKKSSVFETSPVGTNTDKWFLNCVVKISTALSALELLEEIQFIERALGRKPEPPGEESPDRTIDIDIILYGKYTIVTPELTVPHPRATQRLFVLVPLYEIEPNLYISGKPVKQWIEEVQRNDPDQQVRRMDDWINQGE